MLSATDHTVFAHTSLVVSLFHSSATDALTINATGCFTLIDCLNPSALHVSTKQAAKPGPQYFESALVPRYTSPTATLSWQPGRACICASHLHAAPDAEACCTGTQLLQRTMVKVPWTLSTPDALLNVNVRPCTPWSNRHTIEQPPCTHCYRNMQTPAALCWQPPTRLLEAALRTPHQQQAAAGRPDANNA